MGAKRSKSLVYLNNNRTVKHVYYCIGLKALYSKKILMAPTQFLPPKKFKKNKK